MEWFSQYVINELNARDIDSDAYGQYFCSLIEEDDLNTVNDILVGLEIDNPSDFAAQLLMVYRRGHVIPTDVTKAKSAKATDSLAQEPSADVTVEVDALPDDIRSSIDSILDNAEDTTLLEEPVDWLQLIEGVEFVLSQHSPSIHYSSNAIYQALLKSNLVIDDAVSILTSTSEALNKCKPCRHLLAGRCSRSDCWFDHNLSLVPCRYWLFDKCQQEIMHFNSDNADDITVSYGNCPFMHDCVGSIGNKPQSNSVSAPQSLQLDAFPSLPSTNTAGAKSKSKSSVDAAKQPVTAQSLFTFSYARRPITGSSDSIAGHASTSRTSTDVSGSGGWSAIANSNSSSRGVTSGQKYGGSSNSSSTGLLPSDWVESGSSVGANYTALRAEAREFAVARNKLLEEATKAFRGGNRAAAKALSEKGQSLNRQMKECHVQAAQAIFKQRNTSQSLAGGRVDLHGLHVAEAVECLEALLPALRGMRLSQVRVITGSGHHTLGPQQGKSRLFPAVQAYCEEQQHLRTSVIRDDNGYSGGLIVYL